MAPWPSDWRMLAETEASGSGSEAVGEEGLSWPAVSDYLPPETPEQYAVAGGGMVVLLLVLAALVCVVAHRIGIAPHALWHAVASRRCCLRFESPPPPPPRLLL